MVGLTFVIGLLNVCLGYALAVYLGYGPPGLPESWQALTAPPPVHEQAKAVGQASEGLAEDLAADHCVVPDLRSIPAAEDAERPVKP